MKIDQIIVAILSGVAVGTLLTSIKEKVEPTAERAFLWQENTVLVAEKCGSTSALASRAQLEAARPVFRENLDSFVDIEAE